MAYNQKNNPFKKISSSPVTARKSPFFSIETPVEVEGEIDRSAKRKDSARLRKIRYANQTKAAERATEVRGEFDEQFETKTTGNTLLNNKKFIRTANLGSSPDRDGVVDRLMLMGQEDVKEFENKIIDIGMGFSPDDSKLELFAKAHLIDVDQFKPYLKKANISVKELKTIVNNQLINMPDKNKDGTADVMEGLQGMYIRNLVKRKLNSLR